MANCREFLEKTQYLLNTLYTSLYSTMIGKDYGKRLFKRIVRKTLLIQGVRKILDGSKVKNSF